MRVYTYCSYKGCYNGYQYAFFDDNKCRELKKVESKLMPEEIDSFLPEEIINVREFMEFKSGWKLVLKKQSNEEGMLFISKIEDAIDSKKRKRLDELEDNQIKYKLYGKREIQEKKSLDELESDFFLNIVFVGKTGTLKKIAAHYLTNLLENEVSDDYQVQENSWLKAMGCIFEKSDDRNRYLVNLEEYRKWRKEIEEWRKGYPIEYPYLDTKDVRSILKRKLFHEPKPYIRLEKDTQFGNKRLSVRYEDVKEQVIELLLQNIGFSQEYMLVVTNGSVLPEAKRANIVFDIDYIR